MKLKNLKENDDLEQYRQHALDVLRAHRWQLKSIAEDVLQVEGLAVKPIGSVTDPERFTEDSDIDVGFFMSPNADDVNEELSQKVQQALLDYPLGDLGVVNGVVFE